MTEIVLDFIQVSERFDLGEDEKTPFAVRRWSWHPKSYFVVTGIEIKKFPYGNAYGYFHSFRDGDGSIDVSKLEDDTPEGLNCAGCYQWEYVILTLKVNLKK